MGEFSVWHILMILVVVLIFFGPSRLPGLGNSLGKAIRGFKDGMKSMNEDTGAERDAQAARDQLPSSQKTTVTEQDKTKTSNNS